MATTQSSTGDASSTDQRQAKFDQGIALVLSGWQALSVAVENEWGGLDSADKRDWFAGAVSDLFLSNSATDDQDLEELLLQVMEDEFEVTLEDNSEVLVAKSILQIRRETQEGNFENVDKLWEKWKGKKGSGGIRAVGVGPSSDTEGSIDGEDDEEDEEEEEEDGDVEMTDAPAPSKPKEKVVPEVDEDGFTKVVGKKRR